MVRMRQIGVGMLLLAAAWAPFVDAVINLSDVRGRGAGNEGKV